MKELFERLTTATSYLNLQGWENFDAAVILGTGLGKHFIDSVKVVKKISYSEIPGFPLSTVEYHKGELLYCEHHGIKVLVFHGRFHYYEGHEAEEVTFPVRLSKALSAKYLLLSNAAGGISPSLKKGDLMLIDDHINLQPMSPLRGISDERLGPRFVDMSQPYSENLSSILEQIGNELGFSLKRGVYAAVMGPHLETRAEYRYLRIIGADAVGMSTAPEVIVANQIGLPCAAISVITDECDPDNLKPIDIPEIMEIAANAEPKLTEIFLRLISGSPWKTV